MFLVEITSWGDYFRILAMNYGKFIKQMYLRTVDKERVGKLY
jgi:hypothetical protein